MKIKLSIILMVVSCLSTGCGSHGIDVPDRPSSGKPINPELDDDAMRISGEALTLRYDDGGIIFSMTKTGVVSAVRLSDDSRFVFDPVKPALSVNGSDVRLESSETVKQTDGCIWYRLVAADQGKEIYIVVNGL